MEVWDEKILEKIVGDKVVKYVMLTADSNKEMSALNSCEITKLPLIQKLV